MRDVQHLVVPLNEGLDPAKFHRDVLVSSMENKVADSVISGLGIQAKTSGDESAAGQSRTENSE